jgi:hypothetical protein
MEMSRLLQRAKLLFARQIIGSAEKLKNLLNFV